MSTVDYTIAESYELPSKGLIYDIQINPVIRLRSMTVREEMKRQSQTAYPHHMLCEIIDACLLDKLPMSVYDLCLGDYEYLLHKLRIVTYGPEYKMTVGCPHCQSVHEEIVNLDELQTKKFDLETFNKAKTFTLPVTKKEITINIQTPRLLDTIDAKVKEFKRKNKDLSFDPTPLITMQNMINLVDGEKKDYVAMENFIQMLPARDYNYIELKIKELNLMIGIDNQMNVTCSKCGGEVSTFFRFGEEFFRPTIDK